MPIPPAFAHATDWKLLNDAILEFGCSEDVGENDLIAALQATERWRERFTDTFTSTSQEKPITWHRYESLIWALGESFGQIFSRIKALRNCERVFNEVASLCVNQKFGKGRESFVMLLGEYGGSDWIPTLIKLLQDSQVSGHALYALRLLNAVEAVDDVRPFLKSPKAWVRKEAIKFFSKIEK